MFRALSECRTAMSAGQALALRGTSVRVALWGNLFGRSRPEVFHRGLECGGDAERKVDRRRIATLFHGDDGLPAHISCVCKLLLAHAEFVSPGSNALTGEVIVSFWPDWPARSGHSQASGSLGSLLTRRCRTAKTIAASPMMMPTAAPIPIPLVVPEPRAMQARTTVSNESA